MLQDLGYVIAQMFMAHLVETGGIRFGKLFPMCVRVEHGVDVLEFDSLCMQACVEEERSG
jgi:hypothetical protein